MIDLSNGRKLLFLLASGMMGFDARGPTFAHRILYSILKRLGLIDLDLKIRKQNNIVISITGEKRAELYPIMTELMWSFPNLLAVEYNISCSNVKHIDAQTAIKMCNFLTNAFDIPVILKIGKTNNNYKEIIKKTEGLIKAISINSVPVEGGGAISGKVAQEINWRIIKELKDITSTPIIGCSVWNYEDIEKLFNIGAKAVSFGSISMVHPKRPWGPILPTRYVRKCISGK